MRADRTTIGMAHPTVVPANADADCTNGRDEPSVSAVDEAEVEDERERPAEKSTADG